MKKLTDEQKADKAFDKMLETHAGAIVPETAEEERKRLEFEGGRAYATKAFGISPEEFKWFHSGICYSRVGVWTKEAADKVTASVKGQTANGGMLDGMPLGGQQKHEDGSYEIYC